MFLEKRTNYGFLEVRGENTCSQRGVDDISDEREEVGYTFTEE